MSVWGRVRLKDTIRIRIVISVGCLSGRCGQCKEQSKEQSGLAMHLYTKYTVAAKLSFVDGMDMCTVCNLCINRLCWFATWVRVTTALLLNYLKITVDV